MFPESENISPKKGRKSVHVIIAGHKNVNFNSTPDFLSDQYSPIANLTASRVVVMKSA